MVSKWENTCAADVRSSVALRFWVFGCFRELKFPVARYGPVERGVLLRLSAGSSARRRNDQIPRLLTTCQQPVLLLAGTSAWSADVDGFYPHATRTLPARFAHADAT